MHEDLDRLIVAGEMAGDPVAAQRRLNAAALEQEFYAALRADPELLIELAQAASAVAAGEQPPMPLAAKMRRAEAKAAAATFTASSIDR